MSILVDNISTKIISAIEREEIDDAIQSYIEEANDFLMHKKNPKPDFLDDFFEKTKDMLISTVNGCIKSRNNPKKKDDLKKYKEGYFNEIVQNANDVFVNYNDSEVIPNVKVQCMKHNDEYEVICTYPDKGFSLTDIYGFCSRGNSNKSSDKGQEGMYGIGIKSLFCFATYFCIENNIKIELSSKDKLLDTIHLSHNNFSPRQTTLTLRFEYNEETDNKHAGFNVKKLVSFIDCLTVGEQCGDFFYSEQEAQVLFDPRSLMFTELRKNRTVSNSIKTIEFFANGNALKLNVSDQMNVVNPNIKISTVKDGVKYLVFNYPNANDEESLSIAYAINKDWSDLEDRIYATYFVGNSSSPLLERKTGCLINTKAINSSRSGLERENERDPAILKTVKEKGQQTVSDLIVLLNEVQLDEDWKKVCSDVLCQLLYLYRNDCTSDEECLPSGIFAEKVEELRRLFSENKLFLIENKNYIYKTEPEDDIDTVNERITKNKPADSTIQECEKLYELYNRIFVSKDIIYFDSEQYTSLNYGVKKLAQYVFSDEKIWWLQSINTPFIAGVQSLIIKRIGSNDFSEILNFLEHFDDTQRKLIKQLIARFEVNDSFDYMGDYANNNIIHWLFAKEAAYNDREFQKVCIDYEHSYKELKALIQTYKRTLNYYYSTHWNAHSDYWYSDFSYQKVSVKYKDENIIQQFLNLLSKGVFKFGNIYSSLFIHDYSRQITLRDRPRTTTYWDGGMQYCSLDFLNSTIEHFDRFKLFRETIDNYNADKQKESNFIINQVKGCKIAKATLSLLEDLFKWLSSYEYKEKGITIAVESLNNIKPQETNLVKFTNQFLGDLNIRLEEIEVAKNGAKFVGYITNYQCDYYKIKCRKTSKGHFEEVSQAYNKCNQTTPHLVIFYSNTDEQTALADTLTDMFNDNKGYEISYTDGELPQYIENFIDTDNIKQLSSSDYEKYLRKQEKSIVYLFELEQVHSFLTNIETLRMEDIFTILSGKMSYYDHCPICNDIPTLNIKGDKTVSANKNCLVALIPVFYEYKKMYVKTICCKSCFEEYKVSLTEATIITENEQKILKLKSTICDSSRSYDFIKKIKLSPEHWRIIQESNETLE